jgi:hypothetical protein
MHSKTELCVKVDSYFLTNSFHSNIGVRQGDNLSPTLFKIFVNDSISTGTILEKDAYFPSLMDRHTSRLIFCKVIRYTLYYHLSPVVEFSHGAFFC